MKRKQQESDEDISILLKNRIAEVLSNKNPIDVNTLVQVTNAYAKLRSVELKQEEGEFGSDLPDAAVQPTEAGARR